MDLTQSLVSAITRPTILLQHNSTECLTTTATKSSSQRTVPPKPKSSWRVDGATCQGRQFYVVPIKLLPDLVPLRIDVYLPDQTELLPPLRSALQASASVVQRDGDAIAALAISHHICQALDVHCARHPSFLNDYQTLPFGSRLVFDRITADPSEMCLDVVPAHDLERQSKTIKKLQGAWKDEVPLSTWPQTVDLSKLRLERQIHDSISLVTVCEGQFFDLRVGIDQPSRALESPRYIFKSGIEDFQCLYHELRLLLRTKPHPNIIERPAYIVTKRSCFGGKVGVYGFLLPYHPSGSLREYLPLQKSPDLPISVRLKWSKQIVSALIHVRDSCETFYSDLRPDNVLLKQNAQSAHGYEAVLIDFEQRGNWHEWCAPEIRYRMYVEECRSRATSSYGTTSSAELDALLDAFAKNAARSPMARSEVTDWTWNAAWFSLTRQAQEKATVYSFGLLLYCVFEGTCNPTISIPNAWPIEPHIEFPTFLRTPKKIQTLIQRCTDWPEESLHGLKRFARSGDKIVARIGGDDEQSVERLIEQVILGWTEEVELATEFYNSPSWRNGRIGRDRPTLDEVLAILEDMELI